MSGRLAAVFVAAAAAVASAQTPGTPARDGGLALHASGMLAVPRVDAQQRVSFQLTLTNVSAAELRNIAVARVGGSHVSLVAADWCPGVTWTELAAASCQVAAALAPGQSVTVSGALFAGGPLEAQITATVEWTASLPAAAGGAAREIRSRAAMGLGSLTVEDWRVRWMEASTDFALPLVVFGLGIWFQSWLNKREETRKSEESARAEKAEAWRLMLPVSHEYAVKYYAGLVEAAKLMVRRTGAIQQAATADRLAAQREGFYAWLMLHVRKRALQQTGAYYFKNHVGELIVPSLFGAYWTTFVRETGPDAATVTMDQQSVHRLIDRAMEGLEITETRNGLLGRLAYEELSGGGPLTELFAWFRARTDRPNIGLALDYLGAYADILFFEMNKPYGPWFDGAMKIQLATTPAHLVAVFRMLKLTKGPQLAAAALEAENYLTESGIGKTEISTARSAVD